MPEMIEIEDLTITDPKVYHVEIMGMDSILFNRSPDLFQAPGEAKSQKRQDRLEVERATWREKAYIKGDELYIPGENVHESLKEGAQYWGKTIPGEGKKTYTDLVRSAVIVGDLDLGAKKSDLIEFARVVNGTPTKRTPSKIVRIRPLLRPWGGTFSMHVFDARLSPAVLKVIVSYAGAYRGLCDWRPQFGRFSLVSISEEEIQ